MRESGAGSRPGGHFLLIDGTVPDDDPETEEWLHQVEKWRDPSHGRFLSRKAWEELVRGAGLKVLRSELRPRKQPEFEWVFQTRGNPAGEPTKSAPVRARSFRSREASAPSRERGRQGCLVVADADDACFAKPTREGGEASR